MNHIDVLMPIKEGRFIPQEVLAGLASQNTPLRLWVSTTVSDGDYAKARNHIKKYAEPGSYALMLDNDIVLPGGVLRAMAEFLDAHDDFAAIALQKGTSKSAGFSDPLMIDECDHVDMSCVLFRSDDLLALTFAYPGGDYQTRQGCECLKACQDIRNAGKRIGFVCGATAGHVYDTEFRSTEPREGN